MSKKANPTCVWNIDRSFLECYRCGEEYDVGSALPAPITMVAAMCRSFGKEHRSCAVSDHGAELKAKAAALHEHLKRGKEEVDVSKNSVQPLVP